MATKFSPHSPSDRRLGRRLIGVLAILLLVIQPGYSDPDDDGGGGGGGGCGGGGGDDDYTPPSRVAGAVYEHYQDSLADARISAIGYTDTMQGGLYIKQLLGGGSNRFDPRLPGYSYFQGLVQANHHIPVAGQVRIVGGVRGADGTNSVVSLYNGAMITTNAHSFVGAGKALTGGPDGMRMRIRKMEEVPIP